MIIVSADSAWKSTIRTEGLFLEFHLSQHFFLFSVLWAQMTQSPITSWLTWQFATGAMTKYTLWNQTHLFIAALLCRTRHCFGDVLLSRWRAIIRIEAINYLRCSKVWFRWLPTNYGLSSDLLDTWSIKSVGSLLDLNWNFARRRLHFSRRASVEIELSKGETC